MVGLLRQGSQGRRSREKRWSSRSVSHRDVMANSPYRTQSWPKRTVSVWQRTKVQEMLRWLVPCPNPTDLPAKRRGVFLFDTLTSSSAIGAPSPRRRGGSSLPPETRARGGCSGRVQLRGMSPIAGIRLNCAVDSQPSGLSSIWEVVGVFPRFPNGFFDPADFFVGDFSEGSPLAL